MNDQEPAVPDDIIEGLLSTSDDEIDNQLKPLIKKLKGLNKEDAKPVLHEILDQAVHGSLTSPFYTAFFDAMWQTCGGTMDDVNKKHGKNNE